MRVVNQIVGDGHYELTSGLTWSVCMSDVNRIVSVKSIKM